MLRDRLRMEYCGVLNRMRIYYAGELASVVLCKNRQQADEIFESITTVLDMIEEKGAR